jgi:sensitive to high expression protein 9
MLPLRSTVYRPLFVHRFSSTPARNVTRTLPPGHEPEEDPRQAATPASTSPEPFSSTRPHISSEPVASSSKHTSELKDRLRKWTDNTAVAVRGRADEFTSATRTTLSQLGFQLNRMTGYEEIEALKRRVVEQGVYVTAQ